MPFPPIRNLDAFPVEQEGYTYICLRDPEGYMAQHILLSPQAYFVAIHLNGLNGIPEIQEAFKKEFKGIEAPEADIRKIVSQLDTMGALRTENFENLRRKIDAEFMQLPNRPAYFAGKSYPENSQELKIFLDELFMRNDGPKEKPLDAGKGKPPRLLIAPHIDFYRGGHSYAHGYLKYFKQGQPDTVFIFGTAHYAPPTPFILTKKNFDTPFGLVETDKQIVSLLETACEWDPYQYEIMHRIEHSIEFQVVMLSYLFGNKFKIVPILCGAFGPDQEQIDPAARNDIHSFLNACRKVIDPIADRTTVIAGADLAHVGQRFGDPFQIDQFVINKVECRDREDLIYALSGKADEFYRSVMKDKNERRVCGLNCIYSSLKVLDGNIQKGELLHYGYAPDPSGGIVSFANILFQ